MVACVLLLARIIFRPTPPTRGVLVVVVLTLTRIIKSVVTGQAPVTLEPRNTPGKNTNNSRWYTHRLYHS